MIKRALITLALVVGLAGVYGVSSGQNEPDPDRFAREEAQRREAEAHADRVRAKLAELHAAGDHRQAKRVERELDELEERLHREQAEAERHQIEEQLHHMRREVEELHRAGHHDEAERLEMETEKLERELEERADRHHGPPGELEEIERRIHHLVQAAENLHAAGMHGQAEDLMGQAEELHRRREAMERSCHGPGSLEDRLAELTEVVHDLRAEVHGLREVIEELRRRLDELPRGDRQR